MLATEVLMGVVPAALVGAGVTWWVLTRRLRQRYESRLRQVVTNLQRQHEALVDKLNGSHELTKKELERLRRTPARAPAEPRASLTTLEAQLSAAHAELERLRLEVRGPAPAGRKSRPAGRVNPRPLSVSELNNGFAATMPLEG